MNQRIKILIFAFFLTSIGSAQVDTFAIRNELNALNEPKDHKNFWQNVHRLDQHFRGSMTRDSIDFQNLIKSSMYFNKFGYPNKSMAGAESSIIRYVWIHNLIPKLNELTFSFIFQGYLDHNFSEEELRNYYLRSIYKTQFDDDGYKTETIKSLLDKLSLEISNRINIEKLLYEYNLGQEFLKKNHKEIGLWNSATIFDTLYHDGNPIINEIIGDPIRIFQDDQQNYYLQKVLEDGSHFPQIIIRAGNQRYRYFKKSKDYFEILNNGNLRYVNKLGQLKMYTPHKLKR